MIANFRYDSSWEDFSNAIKIVKGLIKQGKAYWLIGFLKDFDLYLNEEAIDVLDDKTIDILQDEVIYLLMWALNGAEIDVEEMHEAMLANNKNVSEDDIEAAVRSTQNKFELVKDSFDISTLSARYNLKKNSVNSKLCDFAYNIYTHNNAEEQSKTNCAIISMTCKRKFSELKAQGIGALLAEREQKEITFVCDETDLDILIRELKEIKQKIREC